MTVISYFLLTVVQLRKAVMAEGDEGPPSSRLCRERTAAVRWAPTVSESPKRTLPTGQRSPRAARPRASPAKLQHPPRQHGVGSPPGQQAAAAIAMATTPKARSARSESDTRAVRVPASGRESACAAPREVPAGAGRSARLATAFLAHYNAPKMYKELQAPKDGGSKVAGRACRACVACHACCACVA